MKKYTVVLLPSPDKIKIGDTAWNLSDNRIITVTQIYDDTDMDGEPLVMIGDNESCSNTCVKMQLYLCSNEIEKNDKVVVVFIQPSATNRKEFDYKIGTLTRKWEKDEYPTCEIDGQNVDLVSEGHTSNVYKVICPIDRHHDQWVTDGMEFDDDEVKLTGYWKSKSTKDLDVGDEIQIGDLTPFDLIGVIKKVDLIDEDTWSWDDQILIENVKEQVINEEYDSKDAPNTPIFLMENRPDVTAIRSQISGKSYMVFEYEIQCPNCKHFH